MCLIGKEEHRARELFYALWIPDLFMKRVLDNGVWSLMCPHECSGLADVWGDKFEALYTWYIIKYYIIDYFLFLYKYVLLGMKTEKDINDKFKPEIYGLPFLLHKLKQELHTCFTKITAIVNQINKI